MHDAVQFIGARPSNPEKRTIANVSSDEGAVVAHAARVKNDRENKIFSTFFRCDVQLDYTPVEFNAMHAAVSFYLQEREVRNLQEKSCTFTGMGSGKSAVD